MADPVIIPVTKRYEGGLTIDLDTPLPKTIPEGCLSLKNMIKRHGRSMAKRPGTKMQHSSEPNAFDTDEVFVAAHKYLYSNANFGVTEEMIYVGGGEYPRIYKEQESIISVNYIGAGTTASLSLLATAAGAWELNLYVDGVLVGGFPRTYADGLSGGTYNLASLVTDIDSLADWTASSSSSTSSTYPMVSQISSIALTNLVPASTPDLSIPFSSLVSNAPLITAPDLSVTNIGPDSDYANLKGVNAQNCMYMPFGKRMPILKYDGQAAMKPGLPRAVITALADDAGGTSHPSGGVYIIRVGFWREDFRENDIYGPYSDDTLDVATHTMAATRDLNVTFDTIYRSGGDSLKQYDPRSAVVNGLQATTRTITVDAGHTIGGVGSTHLPINVKFYDNITSSIVTRTITSVTATTITFANTESAVTVSDNAVISNIMAQIQSTVSTGIDFFEVENIPVNTLISSQTYKITLTDATLGDTIEEQTLLPEPPPNARFACIHQGLIVYADLEDDPNGITWNDKEWGLEACPSNTNRDQVIGSSGGAITAIISESDTSLAIFKERGYYRIEGDLATRQYIITEVADNSLGIMSHASLVKTPDGIFGMSHEGPVFIKEGVITLELSYGIHDYFNDTYYNIEQGETISSAEEERLVTKRSTAVYWPKHKIVLFFIPAESGVYKAPANASSYTIMARYANANSLWLCYDTIAKRWYDWEFFDSNVNAHLSMEMFKEVPYFISSNNSNSTANNYIWRFLDEEFITSYVDNADPIEFAPRLQWENLGATSIDKKMVGAKLYSKHVNDFIASFSITIREYRNDDEATLYTNASRTFSDSADKEKIIEPVLGDFVSNSIEFYNNTLYECPVLSGYEFDYVMTQAPSIKQVQGDG